MSNSNLPYGEGVSIHRLLVFNGENYVYWKIRMRIFIEAIDIAVWDAIENGSYIPMTKGDDGKRERHWSEWSDDERKRAQYDYRTKNIITSALSIDEFFRISQCKSAKEMWDALQVTHEGKSDVKRSRKHTFIREYELLRMNNGESISNFPKRFTHLINHLVDLGRKFEEEELNLKVLQCLDRSWQAKVTAIEESKDLPSLTLATLFGKLREHEQKLHIFEENEQQDNKGKGVSLRALKSVKGKEVCEESSSEDSETENFNLLVKKFRKFLRKKRNSPYKFNKKTNKKEEASTSSYNCFECGKPGHIKAECPNFLKKQQEEKKVKKNGKGKRAYIAWEDNDSSTTTFIQIHKEAVKLDALNSKLKNKLSWYENALIKAEQKLKDLKNEHDNIQTILNFNEAHCETSPSSKGVCENCKTLEKENADLKITLAKFTNGNANLNIILGRQRNTFDRSGLGFNQSMNMPLKSKKGVFKKNQVFRKYKSNFIRQTTCYYCCKKGHTIRNCYSRKYGVPNGEMVWIKKSQRLRTNHQGPFTWVPKSIWYLDSGCSRHMTGDPSKFSSLKLKNEGFVTYGDNNKGRILGHGNIGNSSSLTLIENVLLVEGLKHNLLSISQLSDKGFKIEFDNTCCLICDKKTKEIRFIGKRIDNIYMLDLEHSIAISNTKCLITKEDNIWLWHKGAAHIHMDHLNKLSRKELVIGLPKLKFSKDKLCDACQKGK
uniref:Copia protein n=1 Tax=Cajanus cajan TaxID=3821 RepID=A0A151QUY8_CAJCA|nr:Copia protein [Cajanus cajan]